MKFGWRWPNGDERLSDATADRGVGGGEDDPVKVEAVRGRSIEIVVEWCG